MSAYMGWLDDNLYESSGCYIQVGPSRTVLPQINVQVHATILAATSRTTLTQTFVNPDHRKALDEVSYDFPLYDGVAIVHFVCTVGTRTIKGIVQDRRVAKMMYEEAAKQGKAAALLEQSHRAADVFTARVGNVPAAGRVKVEITYIGELEHDVGTDSVLFTIPSRIMPRYDDKHYLGYRQPGIRRAGINEGGGEMSITVDAEMPQGCSIKSIRSPTSNISVSIGKASEFSSAKDEPPSASRASATMCLGATGLWLDFVIQISVDGLTAPSAVLETHPDSQRRAPMTTLVPRFHLPTTKPEVVFVCDRSGSMDDDHKMPNLIAALQLFLKSLPVGTKFNICSFGDHHTFLWPKSRVYSQSNLDAAVKHVQKFQADYGGTVMYEPLENTFKRRCADRNLEVFLLTDGDIWNQDVVFEMIRRHVALCKGAIRVFTLGIGDNVSSALLQGVARAGNGFGQAVANGENMDKKIIRMLKGALTPHIHNYALEIMYETANDDEDFEMVEVMMEGLELEQKDNNLAAEKSSDAELTKKPISLYDPNVKNEDMEMPSMSMEERKELSELPDAPPPRYLQTPVEVPALFPFIRTTPYVMLSNSTPDREPKSVVVTAKFDGQPLRQEIPVTKLFEKGTLIHQLAACKAIKELEEHSGWIRCARGKSGKLLKDEFEDRFEDMVEREAVRLGLEYQVGGKFCSFVAVEEQEAGEQSAIEETKVASPQHPGTTATCMAAMSSVAARAYYSDEDSCEDIGYGDFDDGPSVPYWAMAARKNKAPFEILISLQTFDGSWNWTTELEGALILTRREAVGMVRSVQNGNLVDRDDILATLCVVAFLAREMKHQREAWELMVDKAEGWLEEQSGQTVEKLHEVLAKAGLPFYEHPYT
ncbi:hypothetical protein HIM_06281 [Hirsutella minnesotensis 3608]|uniref:VIT domain-containing protein n=1 Tax=Hirsutella minnesotensis 3608 TaxID=1043627 RepID=A0A0F7ZNS8_9HYPO|nr:hypothetical protein HIM_06281 [Hirsutella minnesotensis 3608]